ncbi:Ycf66 family protein [Pseudanabaena sp. PCC 6802]|uniref:Ycf66 family protein n=1 Tax=Pseudanabaena sp. PCC 6802 TaxID=118173 RepID=UPI00034D5C0A|nr:Ycf66 family protein [Pseudanabaena sp. PCC 6802]
MINIGGNPLMIILAIVAALGGVGLYFVRSFRPELARDHDIFFSAIALVYGIILLAFNFRMDITTQLAHVLVVGFGGWFAIETLVLRQALSTQARRTNQSMGPIMDDEPIGRDYRVELDPTREIASRRQRDTRRMRGTGANTDRPTELRGDIGQERSSRRSRRDSDSVIDIDDDDIRPVTPKQRRPRPSNNPNNSSPRNNYDSSNGWDDRNPDISERSSSRRRRPSSRPESSSPDVDVVTDFNIRDQGEREDY